MNADPHLLVLYRLSRAGNAALVEASRLAEATGMRITVIAVARIERCDGRCCSIRSTYWNGVMGELADEELRVAREVLAGAPGADFAVARGESVARVLAREAAERGCDLIALPRPTHRWWALGSRRFTRQLAREAGCGVIELPAALRGSEVGAGRALFRRPIKAAAPGGS